MAFLRVQQKPLSFWPNYFVWASTELFEPPRRSNPGRASDRKKVCVFVFAPTAGS
jgi:hypothetical protein